MLSAQFLGGVLHISPTSFTEVDLSVPFALPSSMAGPGRTWESEICVGTLLLLDPIESSLMISSQPIQVLNSFLLRLFFHQVYLGFISERKSQNNLILQPPWPILNRETD
jgi:hypothetical protein